MHMMPSGHLYLSFLPREGSWFGNAPDSLPVVPQGATASQVHGRTLQGAQHISTGSADRELHTGHYNRGCQLRGEQCAIEKNLRWGPSCLAKVSENVTDEAQWTLWHD